MSKHTDSVEARFNAKFNTHPYDKAQHIEYKAKEIIRFIKSEIKKSNSQQIDEAVEYIRKYKEVAYRAISEKDLDDIIKALQDKK